MAHNDVVRFVPSTLTPDQAPERSGLALQDAGASEGEANRPFTRIHTLLRGRYLVTLLLALVLGASGAVAGRYIWSPRYMSLAQVRVAPILPRILFQSEQNDVMPMYDGYIGSQMALMESQRVVDRAMRKPHWREVGSSLDDDAVQVFRESIALSRERGSQIINVAFKGAEPAEAQAGARSVVEAYMEIFGEEDIKRRDLQLSVLEQRRTGLVNQARAVRQRILEIANEYGSDQLDDAYLFKLGEFQKVESSLKEVQVELIAVAATAEQTPGVRPPRTLTSQEIAQYDRNMERLIAQRNALEVLINDLLFYRTEEHPMVKRASAQLEHVEEAIAQHAARYNKAVEQGRQVVDPKADVRRALETLREREARLRELTAAAKRDTLDIGRRGLEISRLREDLNLAEKRLSETETRIEQLNLEASVSGRITVISPGERPVVPANLGQRLQLTALGGAGGVMLTIGGMMLIGLANRRYRYADETRSGLPHAPLLGVLPELPERHDDAEQTMTAALGVHHIRARLQMSGGDNQRVFAITSSAPRDGKTSLACALGMSFATSGARTLLVDFDHYGQGLSARVNGKPMLGDLLLKAGHVTQRQLDKALRLAVRQGDRLGDTLVDLGFVDRDAVEQAAQTQAKRNLGLADYFDGRSMEQCVVSTDTELLDVMRVGNADGTDLATLSPGRVQQFIEKAKQHYDVVLVDCAPVPARLDASLILPHVDGALFVVSQGARRSLVERSLHHLQALNAHLAGFVFNRAHGGDLRWYGASSYSSRERARLGRVAATADGDATHAEAMGPLARATAGSQRPDDSNGPCTLFHQGAPD